MSHFAASLTIDQGRLRIGDDLFVYLERAYASADAPPPGAVPRAHGIAPTAIVEGSRVVAAVCVGEGIWLGFQPVEPDRPVTIRVRLEAPQRLDAVTGGDWSERTSEASRNRLVCPPDHWLAGVATGDGRRRLFAAGPRTGEVLEELSLLVSFPTPASATVQLVTPEHFTRLTGVVPDPIDPAGAYQGWRLP